MSETILKIPLAELQTLRLVCKACNTAMEWPVSTLDRRQKQHHHDVRCPGCGISVRLGPTATTPAQTDAMDQLVEAWENLSRMRGNFEVQFIVKG